MKLTAEEQRMIKARREADAYHKAFAKLRGDLEKWIKNSDAHPMEVCSLIAGIITGLRQSTQNPPEDNKGNREWKQDKVCLAFALELENLKDKYRTELDNCWRNRAGLPRDKS